METTQIKSILQFGRHLVGTLGRLPAGEGRGFQAGPVEMLGNTEEMWLEFIS